MSPKQEGVVERLWGMANVVLMPSAQAEAWRDVSFLLHGASLFADDDSSAKELEMLSFVAMLHEQRAAREFLHG